MVEWPWHDFWKFEDQGFNPGISGQPLNTSFLKNKYSLNLSQRFKLRSLIFSIVELEHL